MNDFSEHDPVAPPQQIFVRADEIDAGTSILSPTKQLPLSALRPPDPSGSASGTNRPKAPPRPGLRREGTGPPPPPPSQPPPAPPGQVDNVTDSLSLPQLKQLVGQFPKTEQRAYAFQYKDAEDFEQEIEEWFHYTEPEQEREYLLASREWFEQRWKSFCLQDLDSDDASWTEVELDVRHQFMSQLLPDLEDDEPSNRVEALGCIYYALGGTWSITSGLDPEHPAAPSTDSSSTSAELYNVVQVDWMHKGANLVVQSGLIGPLHRCLVRATKPDVEGSPATGEGEEASESVFDEEAYRELSLCFSCFYLLVESARVRPGAVDSEKIRQALFYLEPGFLVSLASTISRLRWDESYNIPVMHAIQLLWKSLLLLFGDVKTHLEKIKNILQPRVDPFSAEASHPVLTASPLDYHLFRQEITSKYPAYNPPLPLVPLEVEQKSMLPPLSHQPSRPDPFPGASASAPHTTQAGGSILHQPVHIATPAPSPPPSPIGPGGKAGKKQNYQTNQNFPFLYPPLDSTSNNIGGKGSTEVQDAMVGKQWEGSDIPASIIEAGELFASRMRMTRAMRQLWKERDSFMKYDRGWRGEEATGKQEPGAEAALAGEANELDSLHDPDLTSRLEAVERFFHSALPDLQSLVIVMMKVMLSNVQDIAVRNGNFQDGGQSGGLNRTKSNPNMTQNQTLPMPPPPPRPADMSLEDLDNVRSREISQKAISGAIFLLLKWFKVSHVLKFEYLTQLLLDSNYVQLTLKYFAHQNLEDLVAFKYDREDLGFFHYCHLHSDHPPLSPTSPDEQSEASDVDDAVPPPIQRHRRSPTSNSEGQPNQATTQDAVTVQPGEAPTSTLPSVDELGNPLAPLPATPISDFSFRQFQTSIHLLRALQKVTHGKAHRILLLVQFKSSQILRRVLRVPDPTLRLYVLKLFKSQVPYCGRKWRQSNMRVITAIYLHCRPELRDEWLAGMHDSNVEGEVDDAVPLEWALRGLTYWWQKRMYSDVMKLRDQKEADAGGGGGQEIDDDERDFFQRELDELGWGMAALGLGMGGEGDVGFGEEAPGVNGVASMANGERWEQAGGGGGGGGGPPPATTSANLETWR